jgi:hypothetical protein
VVVSIDRRFALPFVLAWLVSRLGYDRRAFAVWTVAAWVLLSVCYFLMPAPPATEPNLPVNINCVFGMSDAAAQSFMPGPLWFMMLLVGLPAIIFYPTHCLLLRYAGKESAGVEVTDGDANSFRIGIWRRHLHAESGRTTPRLGRDADRQIRLR